MGFIYNVFLRKGLFKRKFHAFKEIAPEDVENTDFGVLFKDCIRLARLVMRSNREHKVVHVMLAGISFCIFALVGPINRLGENLNDLIGLSLVFSSNKRTNRVSFRTVGEESEAEGRVLEGKNRGLRPRIPRYATNEPLGFSEAVTQSHRLTWARCRFIPVKIAGKVGLIPLNDTQFG